MNYAIKQYCRLCAKVLPNNKLISLLNNENGKDFVQKLNRLHANIDLEEKLSKYACIVCIDSLERAYEFILAVEQAQDFLRSLTLVKDIINDENLRDNETTNITVDDCYEEEIEIKTEIKCQSDILTNNGKGHRKEEHISNTEIHNNSTINDYHENKTEIKTEIIADVEISIENDEDNSNMYSSELEMDKSTWDNYSWQCGYCDTQFPRRTELLTHSLEYHSSCNPYRCSDCNRRIYNLDKAIKHISAHNKHLQLSCFRCCLLFKDLKSKRIHTKTHNKSKHVCRGCDTSFSSEEDLKQHIMKYYASRKIRVIPKDIQQSDLTCKLCGKTVKNSITLTAHLLTHTKRSRDHICEVCGKSCLRKYDLDQHMLKHTEDRSYECKICKKSFKSSSYLRNHLSVHSEVKNFPCKICGKRFRSRGKVNFHQVVHLDTFPFTCVTCGKGFNFKSKMKIHERIHTGTTPYSCDVCPKAFTDWSNYAKHMRGAHNKDVRKNKTVIENLTECLEWKQEVMKLKKPGRPHVNKQNLINK